MPCPRIRNRPRATGLTCLLLAAAACANTPRAPESLGDARAGPTVLELGAHVEREVSPGRPHSYEIPLRANDFLLLQVEATGLDVLMTLFDPEGGVLFKLKPWGSDFAVVIASAPGSHRVEMRALRASARYRLAVAELHPANERDSKRLAAQKAYQNAEQMSVKATKDSTKQAIAMFEEALTLWQAAGDQRGEAKAAGRLGEAFYSAGELHRALEMEKRGLGLFQALGDKHHQAVLLKNMGAAHLRLGEDRTSIQPLQQSLSMFETLHDRLGQAGALANLAHAHGSLGELEKALRLFERALVLYESVGDALGQAQTLSNMAGVYRELGDTRQVLEHLQRALPIARTLPDRRTETAVLTNLGNTHIGAGDLQEALELLERALALQRNLPGRGAEILILEGLGTVYGRLHDTARAIDYYQRALAIGTELDDRRSQARAHTNIGAMYSDIGENKKAVEEYQRALSLLSSPDDQPRTIIALNNIGARYAAMGDGDAALQYFDRALALERASSRRAMDSTYFGIGKVYAARHDFEKAFNAFGEGLSIAQSKRDSQGELFILSAMARLHFEAGNRAEALAVIEKSVAILESERARIASPDLRMSYFSGSRNYYDTYIDILMSGQRERPSSGDAALALYASERERARGLLELLIESRAKIRQGVAPDLIERERALREKLNATAARQIQTLSKPGEQAPALAAELDALMTEYREVQGEIRRASPHYAALTQPRPLKTPEIQTRVLDEGSVLLEYALGSERSYLWVVTPNSLSTFELPPRLVIEATARRVYELLSSQPLQPNQEKYWREAARLSRMVLAPAAALIQGKRILIVADGALQYLPFAALPIPSHAADARVPLIAEHEVVNLPSASAIAVLRNEATGRERPTKAVAVIADPVFDRSDPRLDASRIAQASTQHSEPMAALNIQRTTFAAAGRGAAEPLSRLAFSRREAQAILAMVPADQGLMRLDFDANRSAATDPALSRYRIVHFATHGFFNSEHPEFSGIALSLVDAQGAFQDGFLSLHDIYNLTLPAELVVLSACQTALGKEVSGEGLIGLVRGFMYAGAQRVLASLWRIDDLATAELMKSFYRGILEEHLQPAAALRAAQLATYKQKRWRAPYYWSAFTLQGEWR